MKPLVVGLAGLAGRPSSQDRQAPEARHLEDAWSQTFQPVGDLASHPQRFLDRHAYGGSRGADDG